MPLAPGMGVITLHPRHIVHPKPVTDEFFEHHLAGVRARLEVRTKKALERQRVAWREMLRREAVLQGMDFESDPY